MDSETMTEIFKAYDIRGKVGSELNKDTVSAIGHAFGLWLPTKGAVAVGRDMRPDSAELSAAIIEGIIASGRDVIDIGEVTSDMIYFATGSSKLAGGAMITASHNPGEYNGIKLCGEGAKPVGETTGLFEIRDLTQKLPASATKRGSVTNKLIDADWIKHVLSFIDASKLKPLKIAVDAGNGMAGKIFPQLEPLVPWKATELYFELDGSFPNHIANPLIPSNLIDLQASVKENQTDAGLAFDGDGDRAVLVDEIGEPLTGTVMTAILSDYFLKLHPGATILYNAICGRAVIETISKAGGKGVRTKVGHSYIKNDMRTYKAVFAGEHSGHYYFKDNYMADSGLIAAVIALYILGESGQKLSELAKPYREAYVQIPETNFEVEDKQATMEKIARAFTDGKTDWLDGLTINFADSWINVRPSNTEPLLRFNAEAKNQSQLDALVSKITTLLKD